MSEKTPSQKRKSFFMQLVLSNLLISLVCVAAMTTLLLFIYGTNDQTQKRAAFGTAAQASAREVSQMLESTNNIANNIVFVQQVRPFTYRQHPMKAIELVASLNSMKASNPFLAEVYLYFYQDSYVYSSRNSQLVDDFALVTGQDLSAQGGLRGELSSNMRPAYRMHQGELFIFYPHMNNYESQGMIVFRISAQTMRQLLPVQQNIFSATVLFDGELQLGSSVLDDDARTRVQAALSANNSNLAEQRSTYIGFEGGYQIFGTSLSPEIYYLRVTEDSSMLSQLLSPFVYILLLIVCAGAVALSTWYFAHKNYTPVRVLRDSMSNPDTSIITNVYSEFQSFLSGYAGLQEKNRELHRELQEKYEMQQAQLLHALLSGNTDRYEDIHAQALDLGIDLSAACHLLLCVQDDQSLFLEGIRPLMDYRRRYTYTLDGMQNEALYIIGCDDLPDTEALDYINGIDGMCVSTPVTDIVQLHDRYMELCVSRLSLPDTQATAPQTAFDAVERCASQSRRIADALENKDLAALQAAAGALADSLRGGTIPFPAARYLCYEVLYHYRNYTENHMSAPRKLLLSPEALLGEAAGDTAHLAEVLTRETDRLIEQIEAQRTATLREPLELEAILRCVQQHFVEPSFSLQMVAESFDVSPSYLSAYFKENYGMKMLDYCTLLRMEKAKGLLAGDMALLDISQQTGYYNISSFIRRFKQMTGMTPGEYKKTLTRPTD